ncbi:hypothetical protein WJ968_18755 [Achromobacter xylosoxidans]
MDAVHRDQSVLTGGNLTPMTVSNSRFLGEELSSDVTRVSADDRRYFVYPSIVRAVAAGGNIVLADNAAGYDNPVLLLAPSAGGQLEMLAGRSILANGAHAVSMSALRCAAAHALASGLQRLRGLERQSHPDQYQQGWRAAWVAGVQQAAVRLRAGFAHEPRAARGR